MSTREHLMHYVPRPETRTKMGLAALSAGHDGFSAVTDGHVWLTVTQPTSTFSAHTQGALRVVSETDSIYDLAHVGITSTTLGGATFAAGGGVKIMAGYGAEPTHQAPDATIEEPPPAAAEVTANCDEVAFAWTVADTTLAVLLTAEAIALAFAPGNFKLRGLLTMGGFLSIAGGTANLAAAAVNCAGLGGAPLPGINVHAKGGINITTPMFASIYAAAGLLFASPYSTQLFGVATVGVNGILSAGLSSIGKADLSSFVDVGVVGGLEVKATAKNRVSFTSCTTMVGHTVVGDPRQLPTALVTLESGNRMRLSSALGEVRLGQRTWDLPVELLARAAGGGGVPDPALTQNLSMMVGGFTQLVAASAVTVHAGPWRITVEPTGIMLGKAAPAPPMPIGLEPNCPPVGPNVKLGPATATLGFSPAVDNVTVTAASVVVTAGGGTQTISPAGVSYVGFRHTWT